MPARQPTDAARQRAAEHLARQAAGALTLAGHLPADTAANGWTVHPIPGEVHIRQRGGTTWAKDDAAEAYAATLQAAGLAARVAQPGTVLIPVPDPAQEA